MPAMGADMAATLKADAPPPMVTGAPMAEDPAWPDPDGWGLDAALPTPPAPQQALADTLEASREEMLRQISLDSELAQAEATAAVATAAPPPLEAPAREASPDEALADTLEASREVMKRAMEELEPPGDDAPPTARALKLALPPKNDPKANPQADPKADPQANPKTVPVASLDVNLASRAGASWQGDLSLSSEERSFLDERMGEPSEMGDPKLSPPPSSLKTTHWLLIGAVALVFLGAIGLGLAYFFVLKD